MASAAAAKKWAVLILCTDQPKVRLVDKSRGLQGLAGGLFLHPGSRKPAQFLIDHRKKLIRCASIAFLDGGQDSRDISHASIVDTSRRDRKQKGIGGCHLLRTARRFSSDGKGTSPGVGEYRPTDLACGEAGLTLVVGRCYRTTSTRGA